MATGGAYGVMMGKRWLPYKTPSSAKRRTDVLIAWLIIANLYVEPLGYGDAASGSHDQDARHAHI